MVSVAHKRGHKFIEMLVGKYPTTLILEKKVRDRSITLRVCPIPFILIIYVHSSHSERNNVSCWRRVV
jgi:hypothetical protein